MLEPRLMTYGRPGVGLACRWFRRILPAVAVHLINVLGLRIVGLQFVVSDRPSRRDAAVMANLSEIPLSQAEESCAVELRISAHIVVRMRMQLLPLLVAPEFFCVVLGIDVDELWIPVGLFAGDIIATLQDENPLA